MKSIHSFFLAKIALVAASSAVTLGVLFPSSAHAATLVDRELFLSIDVSGSVNSTEFDLQKQGYVNAFNSAAIQSQIASLPKGLAVALGYWSSASEQNVAVGWTLLQNAAQSSAFATAIANTIRPFAGSTAPGSAINFAANQLLTNAFDGKQIIDVSGDGAQNDGFDTSDARDNAFAQGITINGLPILGEFGLQDFYQNNVVTSNGFLTAANDFASFDSAVQTKIGREVGPDVPTPALLPGLVGMGIAALRKRKGEAAKADA